MAHDWAGSHGREQELGHGTRPRRPGVWLVETEQGDTQTSAQRKQHRKGRVTGKAGDRCSTEGWRKTGCLRTA